jgi:hypothetical protein
MAFPIASIIGKYKHIILIGVTVVALGAYFLPLSTVFAAHNTANTATGANQAARTSLSHTISPSSNSKTNTNSGTPSSSGSTSPSSNSKTNTNSGTPSSSGSTSPSSNSKTNTNSGISGDPNIGHGNTGNNNIGNFNHGNNNVGNFINGNNCIGNGNPNAKYGGVNGICS